MRVDFADELLRALGDRPSHGNGRAISRLAFERCCPIVDVYCWSAYCLATQVITSSAR